MRRLPALPHWAHAALVRLDATTAVAAVLGLAALAGWGAFAGKAWSQRDLAEQVELLQADRGRLTASLRQVEQANAEIARSGQEKLAGLREELGQTVAAREAAKAQLAAAQRDTASLKKRLDQARDRVAETGSIKPAETKKVR
ncbi:hypothetical protein [Methylobacterium segetis]|uniref:hypothetical protein n=1 Tax=Methylobacterium segetis TaxID=2488750 RepID=UPI001FDF1D7F|nr:hypothetical protein [Methylobacterium segetis]